MPIDPATIDAMVAAGFSPEQMAVVLKSELQAERAAVAAADEARKARARDGNRDRQARLRAARRAEITDVTLSNGVTHRDGVTEQADPKDPAPLPPQTPPITPTPNTHSDPSGSGSPSAEPGTLVELDPRRELFGRGVAAVERMTGRAKPGCKSLIGKWLGMAQDSAVIVLTVIDSAGEADLASPIPWIEKTIRNEVQRNGSGSHDLFNGRSAGGRPSSTPNSAVATALARHAARRGLGPGSGSDDSRSRDPHDHAPRRDDPSVEDAEWTPARSHYAAH